MASAESGHVNGKPLIELGDPELIDLVRTGREEAFDVLYERHLSWAKVAARKQVDNLSDVDDVVSESYAAVFQALRDGKGPDCFFRGYLLKIVSRLAHRNNLKSSKITPTDKSDFLDAVIVEPDPVVRSFEATTMATAFQSLPERWQAVLWYVDIEGIKPGSVGPLLGLSSNGVSSLANRAREGLRQAYLQNHISVTGDAQCAEYEERLGAYLRDGLSPTRTGRLEEHLSTCSKCTEALAYLSDLQGSMRASVFLPIAGFAFVAHTAPAVPPFGDSTPRGGSMVGRLRDLGVAGGVMVATALALSLAVAVVMVQSLVSGNVNHGALAAVGTGETPSGASSAPEPAPTRTPEKFRVAAPTSPFPEVVAAPPSQSAPSSVDLGRGPFGLHAPRKKPSHEATKPIAPLPEPTTTISPPPSPSPTQTASPSPTNTPTPTWTADPSPTPTPTPSPTPSPSPSPTATPDPSPTASPTPDPSPTPSPTPDPSPTPSPTPDPSPTPTPTPSPVGPPAGAFQIVGVDSGYCLTANATENAPNSVNTCASADDGSQLWTYDPLSQTFQVSLNGFQYCLDASGAAVANGTPVIAWTCNGQVNQEWAIDPSGQSILGVQSGRCLAIANPVAAGSPIELQDCSPDDPNQRWSYVAPPAKPNQAPFSTWQMFAPKWARFSRHVLPVDGT